MLDNLFLLSAKPVIYCANISEMDMGAGEENLPLVKEVREYAAGHGAETIVVCAKTEEELSQMSPEEQAMFLE